VLPYRSNHAFVNAGCMTGVRCVEGELCTELLKTPTKFGFVPLLEIFGEFSIGASTPCSVVESEFLDGPTSRLESPEATDERIEVQAVEDFEMDGTTGKASVQTDPSFMLRSADFDIKWSAEISAGICEGIKPRFSS